MGLFHEGAGWIAAEAIKSAITTPNTAVRSPRLQMRTHPSTFHAVKQLLLKTRQQRAAHQTPRTTVFPQAHHMPLPLGPQRHPSLPLEMTELKTMSQARPAGIQPVGQISLSTALFSWSLAVLLLLLLLLLQSIARESRTPMTNIMKSLT